MSLNLPPSPPQHDHTGGEQTVNTQQSETISAVTFGIDSHDELNTTKKTSAFSDIRTAMDSGGSDSAAVDDVTEHTAAARKINREDIRYMICVNENCLLFVIISSLAHHDGTLTYTLKMLIIVRYIKDKSSKHQQHWGL